MGVRDLECIRLAAEHLEIAGAAITAYDPAYDPDGRPISAARRSHARSLAAFPSTPLPAPAKLAA